MESRLYDEMYAQERDHWWHRGKRFLVRCLISRHVRGGRDQNVLIVGVGTGFLHRELQDRYRVSGMDLSSISLSYSRARGCRSLLSADAEEGLPVQPASVDVIIALDVVEHLARDSSFIKECARVLRPDGRILITVPAFPQMWSLWDEVLDHKCRYTLKTLRDLFQRIPFSINHNSYWNATSFAPAYLIRKIKKARDDRSSEFFSVSRTINATLTALLSLEAAISMVFRLPFGLSCVLVATRNR